MEVSGRLHAPTALPAAKAPLTRRLGATPGRSGHFGAKHKFYCTITPRTLVRIPECKGWQKTWQAQHGKVAGFCAVTKRSRRVKLLFMFNLATPHDSGGWSYDTVKEIFSHLILRKHTILTSEPRTIQLFK